MSDREKISTMESENLLMDVNVVGLSMQYFGMYDYIAFVFMLVICAGIGIYWGFIKKQNTQDYLVGGRNMKIFPISLSLVASYISGISLLGTPTEIYIYGTQYGYILIGVVFTCYLAAYEFLPVFYDLKLTSIYEYFELRFNKNMRLIASVCFAFGLMAWLPIVIYVPALAFNLVSGVNVHIVTPIVCLICIFYTCVGGIQAVVWTDVVQSIIMYGAILLAAIKGTIDVGGISVVFEKGWESGRIELPVWDPSPFVRHTIWSVVIGGFFHNLSSIVGSQLIVQRCVSLPNMISVKKAMLLFLLGMILIHITNYYCGLLIYATYYNCDPLTTKLAKAKDQLFPLLVMRVFKNLPGLPGIFVAGVFSAALSTLSTGLNSMSAVILEDFFKSYAKKPLSERATQIILKSVVVIFGIICVALVIFVEKLGSVLQLSITLSSVPNGIMLGVLIAGFMIPKIHANGAIVGSILGFCIMSWICLGAQLAIGSGDIKFPQKPVSTDGCAYSFEFLNTTNVNTMYDTTMLENDNDVLIIYRLSYLWYMFLGMLITIITSLIISLLWKQNDNSKVDTKLLAPFIRKYYEVKKDQNIQMERM